jgi:hypothetical protein
MNYKVPGLSSIISMLIALAIALFQLFTFSILFGAFYAILIPIVFLNLIYWYCRKCPHTSDGTCRHVIFGRITKMLFGATNQDNYTFKEIIFALFPLVMLVAAPQYWLFQNKYLIIIFWGLMLLAGVIVRTGVCSGCRNTNCTFCLNA